MFDRVKHKNPSYPRVEMEEIWGHPILNRNGEAFEVVLRLLGLTEKFKIIMMKPI